MEAKEKGDVERGDNTVSKNVVIIGGGAGGASVAAEAKRIDPSLSVTLVEGGPYTSVAA